LKIFIYWKNKTKLREKKDIVVETNEVNEWFENKEKKKRWSMR
jgi:hypothetical protein